MINAVKNWYDRHFTRDESVILFTKVSTRQEDITGKCVVSRC